ncbi:unnamed protein product [Symbiodinium pilosum]|uniref:protein-serine/threonine phosphatase n=1 Tax=Symbiodinium pilosum TaxID=2952 RepID=A0A812S6N3_SYMPI|nr:unnamed protein product [Symbiodinium pilosum]
MGSLLDKPVKEKGIETGGDERMEWVTAEMQGWRPDMEDEHIANSNVGEEMLGLPVVAFIASLTVTVDPQVMFGMQARPKKASFHRMDDLLREPANAKACVRVDLGTFAMRGTGALYGEGPHGKGGLSDVEQSEMKESFMKLQKLKQAEKGDEFVPDTVGCTAVCVVVRKQDLAPMPQGDVITANAGDSRAVMCRAGQALELSYDHKPASETEKSRIEAAGGTVEDNQGVARVNGNLNLSRAIGDLEYKKREDLPPQEQVICSTPDVVIRELTPEDEFIVLACDGIWDVMSNQDICDFVKPRLEKGLEMKVISEELLEHCCSEDPSKTQGLGTDNMTVVIVKLKESSTWSPASA